MTTVHYDHTKFAAGIELPVDVANVHDTTPTEAQCITAFGAIATRKPGFCGYLNDADGSVNVYAVHFVGVKYGWTKLTIAA